MSRDFPGTNGNVLRLVQNFAADQDFSVMCYVKRDVGDGGAVFGFGQVADTNSIPRFEWSCLSGSGYDLNVRSQLNSNGNADSATGLTEDEWELCVATSADDSSNNCKIYMNSSTPVTFTGGNSPQSVNFDQMVVGGHGDSSYLTTNFGGKIAQVVVWTTVLSDSDVTDLLAATSTADIAAVQSASIWAHYPLVGSDLADDSASQSDLSVVGTVPSSTDEPLASGPSITNVDGDNIVSSTQTTWTINGSGFGDD